MGNDRENLYRLDNKIHLVDLVRDLQDSLYVIARHAELSMPDSNQAIARQAETSLAILDSYVLACQAERGQLSLELSPVSLGSVMHDARHDLGQLLINKNKAIEMQTKTTQPVMTHAESLKNILVTTGLSVFEMARTENKKIYLRSFMTKKGEVGVGCFVAGLQVTHSEFQEVLRANDARVRLPKRSTKSGVSLQIADTLCRALGGSLRYKKFGMYGGLVTVLPKSDQLAIL